MITVVKDIIDAAKAELAAELTTFSQLDYEYAVEKNGFELSTDRYGFIPLAANSQDNALLKNVTLDHGFQMILTTDYTNQDDDNAQATATQLLYEKSHDMIKRFAFNKLGIPSKVLLVNVSSIDEPEFIEDESIVVLRTNLNVQYRYLII